MATIYARSDQREVRGTSEDDYIYGSDKRHKRQGVQILYGLGGADNITAGENVPSILYGGSGNDDLWGWYANDKV